MVDELGMEAKMTELLTPQSLYDQDILLWVEDTISKLKAHDFANLDLENLIEEIDTLGKSQRNTVRSLLRRLIEHLLKRCYVPLPECYVGWQREIRACRNDIKDVLEDAPSLKNQKTCRETKVRYRSSFTFISALQSIGKHQSYKFNKLNLNQGLISVIIILIPP